MFSNFCIKRLKNEKHAILEIHPEVYVSGTRMCPYNMKHCINREMVWWLRKSNVVPLWKTLAWFLAHKSEWSATTCNCSSKGTQCLQETRCLWLLPLRDSVPPRDLRPLASISEDTCIHMHIATQRHRHINTKFKHNLLKKSLLI